MRLRFRYFDTLGPLGHYERYLATEFHHREVGNKLVDLKVRGLLPTGIEFSRDEFDYLLEHPEYLKHLKGALRDEMDMSDAS